MMPVYSKCSDYIDARADPAHERGAADTRSAPDAGLKAFGMDHGPPSWPDGGIEFVSDEHTTLLDPEGLLRVGDRVRLLPGHLDPTVARHERFWVVDGDDVVDCWPVDLRHW